MIVYVRWARYITVSGDYGSPSASLIIRNWSSVNLFLYVKARISPG